MINYPTIDPVALQLGPVKVHWYGIMYIIGFAGAWWLMRRRAARADSGWTLADVENLLFYGAVGVIAGGRLGSVLFYNLPFYLDEPTEILKIWKGGMSFHGGLLGVAVACWLFARRTGRTFFAVTDFVVPVVPVGLGPGRLGNFINNELWGKPTDVPWGFYVDGTVRHASQLYEAALEGLALFVIVWVFSARPRPRMAVSGLFLVGYGVFRFAVEFVRVPDADIGYLAFGWLTMGQVLSFPMILFGVLLLVLAYLRQQAQPDGRMRA